MSTVHFQWTDARFWIILHIVIVNWLLRQRRQFNRALLHETQIVERGQFRLSRGLRRRDPFESVQETLGGRCVVDGTGTRGGRTDRKRAGTRLTAGLVVQFQSPFVHLPGVVLHVVGQILVRRRHGVALGLDLYMLLATFSGVGVSVLRLVLPAHGGVPVVLYCVVGPSGQELGDFGPLVAQHFVRLVDDFVLLFGPSALFDFGVQMVVPTFPALFSDSAFQVAGDQRPLLRSVFVHELDYFFILLEHQLLV